MVQKVTELYRKGQKKYIKIQGTKKRNVTVHFTRQLLLNCISAWTPCKDRLLAGQKQELRRRRSREK